MVAAHVAPTEIEGPELSGFRLVIAAIVMAAMGAVLIWRLVGLQVLDPDQYVQHGESQRIGSTELAAQRGAIVDRHGVELAVSTPRKSLIADPRLVDDKPALATAVAQSFGADPEVILGRLEREGSKFAWLGRQLDEDEVAAFMAAEWNGVYARDEQTRLTPSGSEVAAGILGRTDIDGNGVSGLELQYDDVLTGSAGRIVYERGIVRDEGRQVTIPDGEYELISPVRGDTLALTIDRTLQFEVERALQHTIVSAEAASGTVVMSRPSTGEILAMATVTRSDGVIDVGQRNRAVTDRYEPGSIAKPLAVAALLEEGEITRDTTVESVERLDVYDVEFRDEVRTDKHVLTTADVLANSSNVGMALFSKRLGEERMHEYLGRFGVGRSTELGFPGENAGVLHPVDDWTGVTLPRVSIGYEFSATPLQMLRAYNAIANDGLLVEPHVVSHATAADGEVTILSPNESVRVVSEETAEEVTALLAEVVERGTGVLASVPGYEIAGKTGTAQIAQPGGGYEDADGRIHLLTSFVGFLPAAEPELSIIVMIEDPAEESSGGRLAAPLFGEISNFALQHLRIPPVVEGDR